MFHMTDDLTWTLIIDYDSLSTVESDQESYGREISIQEKRDYPLAELLKILDMSTEDFPHGLQNYSKEKYGYRAYKCWDDEDWITEQDKDDWMTVGY